MNSNVDQSVLYSTIQLELFREEEIYHCPECEELFAMKMIEKTIQIIVYVLMEVKMLISIDSGEVIDQIPHKKDYDTWISRLTSDELDSIFLELNQMIDQDEIHVAGWLPGSDWTGTVFQPIYEKSARQNFEQAAKCFGLLVWKVFMDRPESWSFGRFEKDGVPIESMTYFRVNP